MEQKSQVLGKRRGGQGILKMYISFFGQVMKPPIPTRSAILSRETGLVSLVQVIWGRGMGLAVLLGLPEI